MFHSALSALTFSSGEFLAITEGRGISGAWSWVFAGGEQVWSPGFYRLLGLVPNAAKPHYELLLSLVHPDDRPLMPSLADVWQGHVPREAIVRVLRPNGTQRTLSLTMEMRFSAEGRPVAVNGTALDVSDREQLAHARHDERRRRAALYLTERIATFSMGLDLVRELPFEMAQVHGVPFEEICTNPFLLIVLEERAAFRAMAEEHIEQRTVYQETAHERLADGELWHFRILTMPVWDPDGTYLGRCGLKYPVGAAARVPAPLRAGSGAVRDRPPPARRAGAARLGR